MSAYFSDAGFKFLRGLARNNRRDWFLAHKDDYERHVRAPFQHLLTDLQPALHAISPHFRADPAKVGGSLFRIQRDTRFAGDKAPYKAWQGARLFHERRKQVTAPSFYIHLEPGNSFIGGGLWHPETPTQRRIRQFIFDNPASWNKAAHDPIVRKRFALGEAEKLVRAPAGFPVDFDFIEDLKLRNFTLLHPLDDATMTGSRLLPLLEKDLAQVAPFIDYLCAALDVDF